MSYLVLPVAKVEAILRASRERLTIEEIMDQGGFSDPNTVRAALAVLNERGILDVRDGLFGTR